MNADSRAWVTSGGSSLYPTLLADLVTAAKTFLISGSSSEPFFLIICTLFIIAPLHAKKVSEETLSF